MIGGEAFHGPKPAGHEVAHGDGNPANAKKDNLRWATATSNNADKHRHGTHKAGERHSQAKLTDDQVRHIRNSVGHTQQQLAEMYGVTQSTVSMIQSGSRWKHLL